MTQKPLATELRHLWAVHLQNPPTTAQVEQWLREFGEPAIRDSILKTAKKRINTPDMTPEYQWNYFSVVMRNHHSCQPTSEPEPEKAADRGYEEFLGWCDLLGLKDAFSHEELRNAYRAKVRQWHPDRLEGMAQELKNFATERLTKINVAYKKLEVYVCQSA